MRADRRVLPGGADTLALAVSEFINALCSAVAAKALARGGVSPLANCSAESSRSCLERNFWAVRKQLHTLFTRWSQITKVDEFTRISTCTFVLRAVRLLMIRDARL